MRFISTLAVLALAFALCANVKPVQSFGLTSCCRFPPSRAPTHLFAEPDDNAATRQRIETLIKGNKVVLFMKGTKFFPQCGFSDTATKILEALDAEYEAVDVLADMSIRQGIKEYSDWPTIPQLYINEEFIGGSDIMINMFQSGELQKMLEES